MLRHLLRPPPAFSQDSLLVHIYLFTEPPYFPPSTKQSLFHINERIAPQNVLQLAKHPRVSC